MTDQPERFTAETSGYYEATLSYTVRGEPKTLVALYEGDPWRDPNARCVHGPDVIRDGVQISMDSGNVYKVPDEEQTIKWLHVEWVEP